MRSPGCEIGVASTKAYTSQIAAITMMALALRWGHQDIFLYPSVVVSREAFYIAHSKCTK